MEKKHYYMVGYTHIDPVWLWNRAEGMQEVKSSFTSALDRMEEFPDFKFSHTSIAYLAWLKENCKGQYERIRRRVEEGRWEIAGGMWIEPDCDLPSGEALIRHFLYGTGFVEQEFGKEVKIGFNPDSFGHSANLPAILTGCGFTAYLLSRPSKEHIDLPPVFRWKSPDGSTVLAERTGGEYMAWVRPAIEWNLEESRQGLEQYGLHKMAVFYGVGNHGGGPTIDNIRTIHELIAEYAEIGETMEFSTMQEFVEAAQEETHPVVEGELGRIFYGCYSSDAEIKQKNRQGEWILLKAEALAAMASRIGVETYRVPAEKLEAAWKELLFQQFHDILAGTSIEPARNAACRSMSAAISAGEQLIADAVQAIANALDTRGDGQPILVINPTGETFQGVYAAEIYVPRALKKQLRLRDERGREIPYAETWYENFAHESRKGVLFEATVPAFGYCIYRATTEGPDQTEQAEAVKAEEYLLDNGILHIELDQATGCPSSIKKSGRELLSSPAGIQILYDDRGAWGEAVYEEKLLGTMKAVKSKVIEANSMRAIVRVFLQWEHTEMRIDYILEKGSDVLKTKLRLNNREKHRQIRFCVPVMAKNPEVLTEAAFLTERKVDPGHENHEYYQHRFADIADEDGSGIAVINNSTYACAQNQNEYRLILSRSSVFARGKGGSLPEDLDHEFMDQGCYDFELWILPHEVALPAKRLFTLADFLHIPLEYLGDSCHLGGKWNKKETLLQAENENVVISCLKNGGREEEAVILRAFETEGTGGKFRISFEGIDFETEFSPYQIKTFRVFEGQIKECDMLERSLPENQGCVINVGEDVKTEKNAKTAKDTKIAEDMNSAKDTKVAEDINSAKNIKTDNVGNTRGQHGK